MSTPKEVWKDIQGYEGRYQVSNLGNVKSLPRIVRQEHTMRKPVLKSHSKAGAKHIYMRRKRYSVEIVYNKVNYYGGGYKTLEEAIKKRDELYEKIHYYR